MDNNKAIPVWRDIGTKPHPPEKNEKTPIVIVGGGPVGLTIALDLGLKGNKVVVLNKLDFIAKGSKAICYAKRTLDIWDRLGVAERMIEKGVIWNLGKVFSGDENDALYQFDLLPIKGQKNPAFINLQQYYTEEFLVDAIANVPNVDIRWGHEAAEIKSRTDGVDIIVETPEGRYDIDTKWLIACDGSRSPIRHMMGLDFEGRIFEDNFLIADVKFKEKLPTERWFWFDPPFNRGQSALLHQQPDDVWRLDFQLGWDIDREACIKPENVAPFVRGMIGDDVEFTEEWYSVYTFQCRRMKQFVHDRVIFAGDSAHLVSPFGARGCNGGVADADNLSWKLDLVLAGKASTALIDSYNYEAVVTADENIMNSSRSTDFMSPKSPMSTALRDATLELARDCPFARPFVNSGRLSTPVSYPQSALNTPDVDRWNDGVKPGSPALDAAIGNSWLLDNIRNHFTILCNGANIDADALSDYNVTIIDISTTDGDNNAVIKRYDLQQGAAYLFRPDQYVVGRWKNANTQSINTALQCAMGNNITDKVNC